MKAFLQAMRHALRDLLSNRAARSTMIFSIIIYSMLYPQPYRSEVIRDVPIAVIDQDGSNFSRELTRRIDASDATNVTLRTNQQAIVEDAFFNRQISGFVIVPQGFERDLLAGKQAPIAAYGDAGYLLVYSSVMTSVTNASRSLGAEVQFSRLTASGTDASTAQMIVSPLSISSISLFNPQGGYASYVVPAAFVLILQQTLLMGIGILHAGKRPLSGIQFLAVPLTYIGFYCVWIALTQILLPKIYGIPRLGTWWHLYAVAIPFLMAVTAMGFALAQMIKTREGIVYFLVVMGMPLFFLSGMSWPMENIPSFLHMLSRLIPSTTAITAFVQVDQMGAGLASVLDKIHTLLGLACFYALLALLLNWLRSSSNAGKAQNEYRSEAS